MKAPPRFLAVASEKARNRVLLAGIGFSSFSALLLELALTRLFSVVLFYHFAFLAISIALLGLGAGGVFAYLGKRRLLRWETRQLMAWLSARQCPDRAIVSWKSCCAFQFLSSCRGKTFFSLTAMYLVSAIPFFVTGLEFSIVFARESAHIPRLYGADLTGGALACLGIVPLLNFLGGPNTILFAGVHGRGGGSGLGDDERHARS